ncbi:hypothetical protein PRIPAC_97452 [Pristionchus pacificus]|uniref:Uncharacterized protein n=1 Tax=Pristionchus pacificus TaxID=54126 RepID=A0A2A6BCE7_PRIPA|nr:hypothetical protein PRIPAC_97452 [Pristionchus pacificus]|eukprot:PDM63534.1 hypothetical protein PRIPAC_53891 [Pristionchus pacificus]
MIIPFGEMSILASVLILLFLPETMGKTLPSTVDEIEDSTNSKKESERMTLTDAPNEDVYTDYTISLDYSIGEAALGSVDSLDERLGEVLKGENVTASLAHKTSGFTVGAREANGFLLRRRLLGFQTVVSLLGKLLLLDFALFSLHEE